VYNKNIKTLTQLISKSKYRNYGYLIEVFTIYMLFTGREVRIGKNCARGLEYVLKTEGTVFPYTDLPAGE